MLKMDMGKNIPALRWKFPMGTVLCLDTGKNWTLIWLLIACLIASLSCLLVCMIYCILFVA